VFNFLILLEESHERNILSELSDKQDFGERDNLSVEYKGVNTNSKSSVRQSPLAAYLPSVKSFHYLCERWC